MLSPDVIACAQRSVLAWLATVDAKGCPNVSPKEVFSTWNGQDFVIANIASPQSVRNLQGNPQACLSFVDVLVQKGFKVNGTAQVVPIGSPQAQDLAEPLLHQVQGRFKIHSVIWLRPLRIEPIVAPSYRFYPQETTEHAQRAAAWAVYSALAQPRAEG